MLIKACLIGMTIALLILISGNFHSASRVEVTPPSTEFSIGTTAASQLLKANDLLTECNLLHGTNKGDSKFESFDKMMAAFSAYVP